ncbi:MAG: glycosyltransferase family 4 protein [Rhodothermales bacterium]
MSRRLLVIAYYFPPMGMSGVQRVTKLVKYLPEYGWQPTVLTVEPGGYFAFDPSLLREVEAAGIDIIRTKSIDPTRLFKRGTAVPVQRDSTRRSWSESSQWVFVPDNKIGWLPFAVRAAKQAASRMSFEAVLSSAPPYTGHLVGRRVSKALGIPLVTDFRDDWLGNPRHVYPTVVHRRWHERLERSVLHHSVFSTTINTTIRDRLRRAAPESDIRVFEQGFDPVDILPSQADANAKCVFTYTGVFYDAQKPDAFLKALHSAIESGRIERNEVSARFVGLFTEAGHRLIEELELGDVVELVGYVEHHLVRQHLAEANVLWMIVGRRPGAGSISTGKLFEYIGTRKPILGLVPDGTAADTLWQYGNSHIVDPDDIDAVTDGIVQYVEQWRVKQLGWANEALCAAYDRRKSAGRMANWLNDVVE